MVATTEHVLFYAFRYALGRTTYAVEDVTHDVRMNIGNISKPTAENMLKEINNMVDMKFDLDPRWLELADLLKKKINQKR